MVKIKGQEIQINPVRDSFQRRAVQFKNNIIAQLKKLGISEDNTDIELEKIVIKKAKASATWYFSGHKLYYSYGLMQRYVDNLLVVLKVIESQINLLLSDKITKEEFISEFREDEDVDVTRKEARKLLGIEESETNLEVINKKYKDLAKECHPDTINGDNERFKELNKAHKILVRELS